MDMMYPASITSSEEDKQFETKSFLPAEYFNRTRYMHCSNEVNIQSFN